MCPPFADRFTLPLQPGRALQVFPLMPCIEIRGALQRKGPAADGLVRRLSEVTTGIMPVAPPRISIEWPLPILELGHLIDDFYSSETSY